MSQSKQTNDLIKLVELVELKEFDQDYRNYEIDTGDLKYPDVNPALLSTEFRQCEDRLCNWKEHEIPRMDNLLRKKTKQLVELVIRVVDQRLLAGKEVASSEFSLWAGRARTDWVSKARLKTKKDAERKADAAIAEQKTHLEQEIKTLERQALDLKVELEAAKDWSALKRKFYETP